MAFFRFPNHIPKLKALDQPQSAGKECPLTCDITQSKDILCLHFAVDQVLSISGYDLENGRMPCKQKY